MPTFEAEGKQKNDRENQPARRNSDEQNVALNKREYVRALPGWCLRLLRLLLRLCRRLRRRLRCCGRLRRRGGRRGWVYIGAK